MTSKYLRFNTLLKGLILTSAVVFIFFKLSTKESNLSYLVSLTIQSLQNHLAEMIFILILMPVNWSLEALKWKELSEKVLKMNFAKSLVGVVSGLGLSFWTPHGIGDYFGRIGQITHKDRKRLVGPIFFGRLMQLLTTLLFGMIGVYYLLGWLYFLCLIVVVISGIVSVALSNRIITRYIHSRIQKFIYTYIGLIWSFSFLDSMKIFGFSVLRYLVFTSQFYLAIKLFLPELDVMLILAGITWVFLAKSLIPTFNFLSDLGIREFSAVLFFDSFSVPVEPIVLASLLIWVINILIPTLGSMPLMWKLKLLK